ncbi:MAG: Hydrogen cyanide synthase subunit HcnB [Candidatus Celerinatantimonas neptuna]|nr:MAG: Hydrogen cyanide synthase subunit HcnB [Candidatus Celerinatantimonas neptuna]
MERPRIVIIGAGPAGVRCAKVLADQGLRPVVIDEQPRSGGQIYRRQPEGFKRSYRHVYGSEYHKAKLLHQAFDDCLDDIDYYPDTSVWAVQHQTLYAYQQGIPVTIEFDYLVLCTGATDRVLPVKGWEMAGTYTLGGAQIALKHQACAIGRQVAFTGTGPLLYLVAWQYLKAGAKVAGVFDTADTSAQIGAFRQLLVKPKALWQGLKMIASLRRAGVPVYSGITPQQICGDDGVSGFDLLLKNGQAKHIECDALAMGFHIKPEMQLADLAGCEFHYDVASELWLPDVDLSGRTSLEHVFSAGDGCRILGADAAEVSGQIAALSVLQAAHLATPGQQRQHARLVARLKRLKRFGDGMQKAFPWPSHLIDQLPDDAVVCRCEAISKAQVKQSVHGKEATEVNRSKSFSRVGMGRCQGRYCAHVNAQLIARERQQSIEMSGRQRSQAPVKPIPVNVYVQSSVHDVSSASDSGETYE